jgi:hypothetical protein
MTLRLLRSKYAYRTLTLAFLVTIIMTLSAQFTAQEEEGGIPAYNAGPPAKGAKLPDILTKDQLWGADAQYPYQTHAYDLAAKIPVVLHQQPCYCYCDRMGHNSLHSCFENTHGARSLRHVPERALLFLSAARERQDRSPDSRRHHQGRLEND